MTYGRLLFLLLAFPLPLWAAVDWSHPSVCKDVAAFPEKIPTDLSCMRQAAAAAKEDLDRFYHEKITDVVKRYGDGKIKGYSLKEYFEKDKNLYERMSEEVCSYANDDSSYGEVVEISYLRCMIERTRQQIRWLDDVAS